MTQMRELLYHNIYTLYLYKCKQEVFIYFQKNLITGFILEHLIDIKRIFNFPQGNNFFLIIDQDRISSEDKKVLREINQDNSKIRIIYLSEENIQEKEGLFFSKSINEYFKIVKYIKAFSQKEICNNYYTNLNESIVYAGKIQKAILPEIGNISEYISDIFVFNKPRDVVSGDFYWYANINEMIFIAVGDCTGHGVPGAFMSILGITLLNEIIHVDGIYDTDIILNNLRKNIIKSLSQSFSESNVHDGMDLALCSIRPEYDMLQYSGAFNPVVIIRDDELIELKADRMPVGIFIKDDIDFSKQFFDLKKNDRIYMFSDGYSDQIGGVNTKKLRKNKFYDLLFETRKLSLAEQHIQLNDFIMKWKGSNEQIDDMLIIGLEI